MNDQPLARVDNLYKQFGTLQAVRGLDFQIMPGDVLGFLGCNGAGKTTTMAMLAGVLAPDQGAISIAGHDLLTAPVQARAQLGYLPEIPPLYPELCVHDYLHFCARLRRIPRAQIARAVAAACERCDLGAVGARLLGNLSKGYRQRVGIAQAIVHNPQLVILDEPTSGLDPAQTVALRDLITTLGKDQAVILSTHNLAEVQATCNRLLILHQGSLRLDSALPGPGNKAAAGGRIYRLVFIRPPDPQILAQLDPRATLIEVQGNEASMRLADDTPGASPVLERLLGALTEQAWGLAEIGPRGNALENLFMRLTCGQEQESAS